MLHNLLMYIVIDISIILDEKEEIEIDMRVRNVEGFISNLGIEGG